MTTRERHPATAADDDAASGATVVTHPAAGAAAARIICALADEFDRWMADDIEELAESFDAAAPDLSQQSGELALLTGRLVDQANVLGHPRVAAIAARLHDRIRTIAADASALEDVVGNHLGELRGATTR